MNRVISIGLSMTLALSFLACGTVESAKGEADIVETVSSPQETIETSDVAETVSSPADDDGSNATVPETTTGPNIQCNALCEQLFSGQFSDPFSECVLDYLSEKQVDVEAACPGGPPSGVDECVSCVDQAGGSSLCQYAVELCSNQPPPK